jgi:signal peptidase I
LTIASKKLWKSEYFQTALTIVLIIIVVFGFWYGSQAILRTNYPALAVVSGSMCIPYDAACNGWDHPFARTLHVGDLLIIQGVNPESLNDAYPNSDIIVFHKPGNYDELIVHRIVKKELGSDGTWYFYTKGDGNSIDKWPSAIQPSEYDPWQVPQNYIVGKVAMRIPWLGHVVLFMHDSFGVPLVIFLIVILVIVEFLVPVLRRKKAPSESNQAYR